MKIEQLDAWGAPVPLPAPFSPSWIPGVPSEDNSVVIYKITTDDGIEGVSGGIQVFEEARSTLPLLRVYLRGRDVTTVEDILKILRSAHQIVGFRAWHVEPALWDVIGKAAGLPVHRLLGGARDSLDAYCSTGELKTPDKHVETVLHIKELGFRAVKLRVRHLNFADDVAPLKAVREAVGDDFTIMVDANQGWRDNYAKACQDYDVYRLEEPLYQHDYDGYARLRDKTTVRIAGGEMLAEIHPFREHLQRGGLDVVQPDVSLSGGILISRKVSILAEAFGAEYAPHTWTNENRPRGEPAVHGGGAQLELVRVPLRAGVVGPRRT